MVGVLITLLFAFGAMGVGQFLVSRWTQDQDPAEALGVHGLVGLGALGLLTLPIGLMPDGLKWGLYVIGLIALAGLAFAGKRFFDGKVAVSFPKGPLLLFALAIGIAGFFALVGVLAPSDTLDWDTLAYHLAVPKVWLSSGHIQYIPYDHHSNFPATVENLFAWGLTWGGQSGAKAFTLSYFVFGVVAIFGLARSRYGDLAGWWAALAFATVPVVMWESGTGYIDVPHGLYGGLGILYAARFLADPKGRSALIVSGIMLGFAAGTKYTGLQTIATVCLVLLIASAARKQAGDGFKAAVLVGIVGMAIGAPWYIKTFALTGNPVFPFFFERFGGKNWDQRRADTYRVEQQAFGAGTPETRHQPAEAGNAVLGLVYQPGRYVNPREDRGLGTPLGAIGVVVVAAGLLWALSGKLTFFESSLLGVVGISMLMWFFLSEQSRYVVPLCVPLAVLAGGGAMRLKVGQLLSGVIVLQSAYSLYLVYTERFIGQADVAFGKVSAEDYQAHSIGFYDPSRQINKLAAGGKVALYDEVFGYLLDVPYIWANPPHSMLIPYDSIHDGATYAEDMKKLGFTDIYISTSRLVKDPEFVKRWIAAMGFTATPTPFSAAERQALISDWKQAWMVWLADAVRNHRIEVEGTFKQGILFKIP